MRNPARAETRSTFDYASLEEAFPSVDPEIAPYGSRVLVQIRTPKTKTSGGIVLPQETRDTEQWNTQVAKVISLGPVAFRNRETLELWPEGEWCRVGEYVRVPKYGGDRWQVPVPGQNEQALFVFFNDLNMIGRITGNPLSIVAFV
jgi:co-chaperonin GroES (HSP10)